MPHFPRLLIAAAERSTCSLSSPQTTRTWRVRMRLRWSLVGMAARRSNSASVSCGTGRPRKSLGPPCFVSAGPHLFARSDAPHPAPSSAVFPPLAFGRTAEWTVAADVRCRCPVCPRVSVDLLKAATTSGRRNRPVNVLSTPARVRRSAAASTLSPSTASRVLAPSTSYSGFEVSVATASIRWANAYHDALYARCDGVPEDGHAFESMPQRRLTASFRSKRGSLRHANVEPLEKHYTKPIQSD
ncbi:hypothetical protein EDB85DRAFT_999297 [Lactarius pseudohatsudake]|nr:hypothetical protein EDB85DRAFT_999297 [Lactarius pseudohatsudake]